MIKGERCDGRPFLVGSDLKLETPEPIDFLVRAFDEGWIQELIRQHPEILPASQIDDAFSPLLCIGREVPTADGPIDNLYVSPSGLLTLVETKLWRNPQARREAVAQLLDYAKELQSWAFEDLDVLVRAYQKRYVQPVRGLVGAAQSAWQVDEAAFVDGVMRSLQRGRFLLLVVGDGIRESVEQMADFLSQTPQMHFTLGLVELQVYEASAQPETPRLVIPRVVMRTREVTRAVVRVDGPLGATVHVGIDTATTDASSTRRRTLDEDEFFDELHLSAVPATAEVARKLLASLTKRNLEIEWKSSSFVAKLPDPGGSGRRITILVVTKGGEAFTGWGVGQLKALGYDADPARRFVKRVVALFPHLNVAETTGDFVGDHWSPNLTLAELASKYDAFLALVDDYAADIRRAAETPTS
jgi:hypothetical protein